MSFSARSDKLYDDMGIIMTKYSGESMTPEKRKSSDAELRPSKAMKEDDAWMVLWYSDVTDLFLLSFVVYGALFEMCI